MDDKSLFTMLTMVNGIGSWSVHMFMISSLHRPMFYQLMISGFGKEFNYSTIWRSCRGLRRWINCVRNGDRIARLLRGISGGLWSPKGRLRVLLLLLVFNRCRKRSSNSSSSRPSFSTPLIACLTLGPVLGDNDCH